MRKLYYEKGVASEIALRYSNCNASPASDSLASSLLSIDTSDELFARPGRAQTELIPPLGKDDGIVEHLRNSNFIGVWHATSSN